VSWISHFDRSCRGRDYSGKRRVKGFFDAIFQLVDVTAFTPTEFVAQGDSVVSLGSSGVGFEGLARQFGLVRLPSGCSETGGPAATSSSTTPRSRRRFADGGCWGFAPVGGAAVVAGLVARRRRLTSGAPVWMTVIADRSATPEGAAS